MKKSLIALAVAGAMTAPIVAQADATLYGQVETRLQFVEDEDANLYVDKAEMGVKGSDELSDSLKTNYQIEFRLNANGGYTAFNDTPALSSTVTDGVQMRKANVGLEGGWGIVQIGRQNNLGAAVKKTDIFMAQPMNYQAPDRFGNSIYYVTPNIAGFDLYGAMIMDGASSDKEEDVDAWQLGFNYTLMGIDLSLAYTGVDGNYTNGPVDHSGGDDVENWGAGASWAFGPFAVMATYEWTGQDNTGWKGDDFENETWGLAGTWALGDAVLKAGFGQSFVDNEVDGHGGNDYDGYSLQAAYALGPKATVKAEWDLQDYDSNKYYDDVNIFTFSYAVAF